MSDRHVCMVVKNRLSNDARVKKEIRALSEDGWRVTVIAMPESGFPEREITGGVTILRPPIYSRKKQALRAKFDGISKKQDPSFRARALRILRQNRIRRFIADLYRDIPWEMKLRRAANGAKADVYHANDLDTLHICALAAKRNNSRLVYDSHELWLESSRFLTSTNPLNRIRLRWIERRYLPRADAVIAVTPMRGEAMLSMYPRLKRLEIIENAPEILARLPERGKLRKLIGADDNTVIALYQGVLCPERGLEELLQAAKLCGMPSVKFVLIGMDAWNGTLQEKALSAGLQNTVIFLPPVPSEDLPDITVDADMGFILFRNTCLNHYYSLPNKLYEYMMAGVPIISSNFPELRSVLEGAGCGVTVDPESPEAICSAVETIAQNREKGKKMGTAGREAALELYNWEPQKNRFTRLYREMKKR